MRLIARRILRLCGLLVSILAVIWIGARFIRSGALDLLAHAPVAPSCLIALLLAGALAYALIMCLPGLAWWRLAAELSPRSPPLRETLATYAVSQYGKYLPGNVAHYALRHAWSRRYGLPHESLTLASILEAMLLLLAALALTLAADTRRLAALTVVDPYVAIVLLLFALALLAVALFWIKRRNILARLHVPTLSSPVLLACTAFYLGFFVLCGGVIAALSHVLALGHATFPTLLAATAASWLAGFIVIGAPAGLGVREAIFVALTGSVLGEANALLLIGLFRVVTFTGDTIFLAAGAALLRFGARTPNHDPSHE